jgi:hypothetical protein
VTGAAGEVGLPTAKVGRADPLDWFVAEPGPYIEPQAALGHRQGGGAAVGVGGPDLPPLLGPPAERELAALEPLPDAAGNAQSLGHHVLLFTRTRIAWSVDPIPPELQLSTPVYFQ